MTDDKWQRCSEEPSIYTAYLDCVEEIERLRAELAAKREISELLRSEIETLRIKSNAELAAANAQLEEAREQIDVERYEHDALRIDAALKGDDRE